MLLVLIRILDTDVLKQREAGFTLIEIVIALLILTVAVLGLAVSTGRILEPTGDAEVEYVALAAVEDRIAEMSLDPRYTLLDSIYGGTETGLTGLAGMTRTTTVTRSQETLSGGGVLDFQTIHVAVSGGRLKEPVSRSLGMGAP